MVRSFDSLGHVVSSRMVCRCVATGCNNTHKDGGLFPSPQGCMHEEKMENGMTRLEGQEINGNPLHIQSCVMKLLESIGLEKKMKPRLKADAMLTLFDEVPLSKRSLHEVGSMEPKAKKKKKEKICL